MVVLNAVVFALIAMSSRFVEGEANITDIKAGKGFFLSSDEANFFQAYFNCKDGSMDLVSIAIQQDEEDLAYFLRSEEKTSGFWLSATNLPDVNSTQYYWLTGGKKAFYTNWLPNEPNNDGGNEHCLQWQQRDGVGGWNDNPCDIKLKYICQN